MDMAAPLRSFAQAASTEEAAVPLRVVQVDGLVCRPWTPWSAIVWEWTCMRVIVPLGGCGKEDGSALWKWLYCFLEVESWRFMRLHGYAQVALKIIKHCKECWPTLVTGQLLGLDIGSILEVTNCFPFPVGHPFWAVAADIQWGRDLIEQGKKGFPLFVRLIPAIYPCSHDHLAGTLPKANVSVRRESVQHPWRHCLGSTLISVWWSDCGSYLLS